MPTRREEAVRLAELVGSTLHMDEPGNGWPGIATVVLSSGRVRVAIHVGPVGLSHRERDDVERRFQNPSKVPVLSPSGTTPILIGVWKEGSNPVLVGFDAQRRIGRPTRFSLFCPLWLLTKAAATGWAEHVSASDEPIVAFHPALLPVYIEILVRGTAVSSESLVSILDASGLIHAAEEPAGDRARRAALALVRRASFGKQVVGAYGGLCAMCGLNLGLCQGAHIYPVSAPSSSDEVWNGLALCSNHHTAFDRHLVWIEPDSRRIAVHPRVIDHARESAASRAFLDSTMGILQEPQEVSLRPTSDVFVRRYGFYEEQYDWAS